MGPISDTARTDQRLLISIAAAAERLGCGDQTVRDFISAGKLPAFRVGGRMIRVYAADVDALLIPIPTAGRVS
jgi:excisionase family DNA binding protein